MTRRFFDHRRDARASADTPVESALRRSLAVHALDTPGADDVARGILVATDDPDPLSVSAPPGASSWRRAGLPLIAAATVAAVVGVGAAVASLHGSTGHQATTDSPSRSVTSTASSPTDTSSRSASPTASRAVVGTSGLKDVKVLDLTFIGDNRGFALAAADCIGKAGRCTALLQTTNGTTWKQDGGGIDFDVHGVTGGCPLRSCVDHLRFANPDDGFAYGPDAFFVTTNGGATWTRQPGGAEALETLDGNTIRVSGNESGECLPQCSYTVRTADVGSTTWSTVPMPGATPSGIGVQLSRSGSNAYLLVTLDTPGGGDNAGSTLYRSTDDGRSWTTRDEPCPRSGGNRKVKYEVDSYQVAAGTDGAVTVLCQTRGSNAPYRFAVSTDAGKTFHYAQGTIAAPDVASPSETDGGGSLPSVLVGGPSTVLAVAGNGVWLSRDGGTYFTQAPDLTGTFATVGFESTRIGRAVTSDGSQIWTTRNAGRTWARSTP